MCQRSLGAFTSSLWRKPRPLDCFGLLIVQVYVLRPICIDPITAKPTANGLAPRCQFLPPPHEPHVQVQGRTVWKEHGMLLSCTSGENSKRGGGGSFSTPQWGQRAFGSVLVLSQNGTRFHSPPTHSALLLGPLCTFSFASLSAEFCSPFRVRTILGI